MLPQLLLNQRPVRQILAGLKKSETMEQQKFYLLTQVMLTHIPENWELKM